jgi:hypothetical protein
MARTPSVTLKFPGRSPAKLRGQFEAGRNEALRSMLKLWHTRYLPRHFTASGARMYSYSLRGATYETRKLRKFKHSRPLVYTGALEKAMTGYMPNPVIGGSNGKLRYVGLPWYTRIRQKVSYGQVVDALDASDGDMYAAAQALKVSYRTIQRRIQNQVDVHEANRLSKWQITKEEMGKLVSARQSVDPVLAWAGWRMMAQVAMDENGGDIKAAANSLGWSMSRVGKLLRNETYAGRAHGQTADKIRELVATTDEEARAMQRVAREAFLRAVRA